jgi:hypothetical protein
MMSPDWHDEGMRDSGRSENTANAEAMARSLEEHGVDITGSESGPELTIMRNAVDGFRRAAETLAGHTPVSGNDDLCRHVVPPRAADETPRQYAERVNRMTERFRALTQGPSRERPR